jgi:FPC/CPF motif-containing protein YcgG
VGDGLEQRHTMTPTPPLAEFVHDNFRALVLNDRFTCLGAKSAVRRNGYRFALYEELGGRASVEQLAVDLGSFASEAVESTEMFTTFVASFVEPAAITERTFEARLWATLQALHDLDAAEHEWNASVSADPADPHFAFSFAGAAFFIVGLHGASSRATRRFAWPTLVFNPHQQFEELRRTGRYHRFRDVIRESEATLQGGINPMLAEFGERSEASQYSGRRVEPGWKCPFHAATTPEHPDGESE